VPAAILQHFAPTLGAVSLAEPVGSQAAHVVRLEGAFGHGDFGLSLVALGFLGAGSQPRGGATVKPEPKKEAVRAGGAGRSQGKARKIPALSTPTQLHRTEARDSCPSAMRDNIRLVSTAGTGFTYYTTKNKRTQTAKLEFKKYDPVVRKHVVFKEQKMPPHSK